MVAASGSGSVAAVMDGEVRVAELCCASLIRILLYRQDRVWCDRGGCSMWLPKVGEPV